MKQETYTENGSRRLFLLILLCAAAVLLLTGCGEQLATADQMKEFAVKSAHGEEVELVEEISERRLHFRTKERGVEFDVWTFGSEVQIDGSHVYYTDDYAIAADYEDGVYNLYRKEIEELIEDCELKTVVYSPQFDRLSEFTIAVDENASEEQLDKISTFLGGLRDIAEREAKAHTDGFGITFVVSVLWHGEDGYVATKGDSSFAQSIKAGTPDERLDIRNYERSANRTDNATAPDRNGVLLEVKGQ